LDPTRVKTFLLPFEQLAIISDRAKITSRVAPVIRFHLGRVEAKKFYMRAIQRVAGSNKGGLGWSDTKFESVNWKALEHAICNKPEAFNYGYPSKLLESAPLKRTRLAFKIILTTNVQTADVEGRIAPI
jgi:hypothetical protein